MRTTRRLAVVSAVLGGGLLLAGPAAAQTAPDTDCDQYETLGFCPIEGEIEQPAVGDEDEDEGVGSTGGGSTAGGSTTSAASLPFTGGEVTLIALAGAAALGGGIALTAAGRKRSTV